MGRDCKLIQCFFLVPIIIAILTSHVAQVGTKNIFRIKHIVNLVLYCAHFSYSAGLESRVDLIFKLVLFHLILTCNDEVNPFHVMCVSVLQPSITQTGYS